MTTIIDRYAFREADVIGSGQYGKVYKGTTIDTKEIVAIKSVPTSLLKDTYFKGIFKNEINSLRKLNSPHIVKLFDLKQRADKIYLITEFCDGGNLASYLARRKRLTEEEVSNILWQVAQAFKEMMKLNILHRDLKPENLLIHKGLIKVGDYGFSKPVKDFKFSISHSYVGSPIYMAPQLLFQQNYTSKADVWSMGVMAYQLLYGYVPWNALEISDLLHQVRTQPVIYRRDIPISPEIKDLISRALKHEERARISWEEVFVHPAILKSPMQAVHEEKMSISSQASRVMVTSSPAPVTQVSPSQVTVPKPLISPRHPSMYNQMNTAPSPAINPMKTSQPIQASQINTISSKPHNILSQPKQTAPVATTGTPVTVITLTQLSPREASPTTVPRPVSQSPKQSQVVTGITSPKAQSPVAGTQNQSKSPQSPFNFQASPTTLTFTAGQTSPRNVPVQFQRPASTTAAGSMLFTSNAMFGPFPPQSPTSFGFPPAVPGMRMTPPGFHF